MDTRGELLVAMIRDSFLLKLPVELLLAQLSCGRREAFEDALRYIRPAECGQVDASQEFKDGYAVAIEAVIAMLEALESQCDEYTDEDRPRLDEYVTERARNVSQWLVGILEETSKRGDGVVPGLDDETPGSRKPEITTLRTLAENEHAVVKDEVPR